MKLSLSKSKNSTSLYVTKSIYVNGKHTTKVIEKLGTYEYLKEKLRGEDPIEWAKEYIKELNRKEKEENQVVMIQLSPTKPIDKGEQRLFNGGYLFLQKIYHELGLHNICNDIAKKHKITYPLNEVLSRLIYGRIIYPSSKLATYEMSKRFIEQPAFELQHVYRALDVLAQESNEIQASLYRNSMKCVKRETGILYYDCTNYFFEIEQEDGLKQYGVSKEHRPNPIVQMGLFMDGDGIPLAFQINPGNTNEQKTLIPMEEQIMADFELSKFVVCTDAGVASIANRKFNDKADRAFITTQSLKQLKEHLKSWALDGRDWRRVNDETLYDIKNIDEGAHINDTFYKMRWINENGLEQKLIVTYSVKYKRYQQQIRALQIERAEKTINGNPTKLKKANVNDYKRFIRKEHYTKEGHAANKTTYSIDHSVIARESQYDGFYGVCTNLEDEAIQIIQVNKRRWEIEECFRIMKSEFESRPVYLTRDNRIIAHFMTCFIALIIFRLFEKKFNGKYTCHEIISGLREMNFLEIKGEGLIPVYKKSDFTDDLHSAFGFNTDFQIIKNNRVREIIKSTSK